MTNDRYAQAQEHARRYHECVLRANQKDIAPNYGVWTWDEIPDENKALLYEASLLFLEEDPVPNDLAALAAEQIRKHGKDRYPLPKDQALKLVEEVGELAKEVNRDVWNEHKMECEFADVALALFTLAKKCAVDLESVVVRKVATDNRNFRGGHGA